MIPEAEAVKKWCPLSRGPMGQNRASAADDGVVIIGPCIGSACMAWRWVDDGDRIEHDEKQVKKPEGQLNPPFSNCPEGYEVSSHDSAGWYWCRREISRQPPRGYCGAFGRPE